LDALRPVLPAEATVSYHSALYRSDASRLLRRIGRTPDAVACVMVVGHNPAIHDLAVLLAGHGDADVLARMRRKLPTGTLVVLDADTPAWIDLRRGSARLSLFLPPADIAGR